MARLASDSQMGFYPTSVISIQKVLNKTILFPEDKTVYALDCCAGEGEAIEMIGNEYNCETYAVELEEQRAITATSRNIKEVLNADALSNIRKSNSWVGLNFLNPPYGTSASGSRLELDFIERWGLTTVVGGVLIFVINPSSADEKMANALRLQGYRPMVSFYDENNEDYKKYGQFFMVLQKQLPNFRASVNKFQSLFENPLNIDEEIEFEKISIRTGLKPSMFKEIRIPRWKVENSLKNSKLEKVFFDELRSVGVLKKSIEHVNDGQAAILISSGALNKKITLSNGDEVLLKGTSTKGQKDFAKANESGDIDSVRRVDYYKTVVYGLDLTHGQFVKYE